MTKRVKQEANLQETQRSGRTPDEKPQDSKPSRDGPREIPRKPSNQPAFLKKSIAK